MLNGLDGRAVAVMSVLLSAWVAGPVAGELPTPKTHFVRVSTAGRMGVAELGLSPSLDLDYGPFAWLELTAEDFVRLQASGLPYSARAAPYTLRLGEQSFDPLVGMADSPGTWDAVRADRPDLHLVQFVGPARGEWLDDIEASGLQIVQYIHPFTYIVWGQTENRAAAGGSEAVRWTGPFLPAYRVLPRWPNLLGAPVPANVLLYRGADTEAARLAFRALGAEVGGSDVLNPIFEVVELTLPGGAFQAAAAVPGVYSIQPLPTDGGLRGEMSDQISVGGYDENNLAYPGYFDWIAEVGLSGAGVIIANVDGGIQDSHPDLVNRLVPCTGETCGGGAQDTHGTHTAGIMAADGSSGILDGHGFLRGLGQAPGANLVEQLYWPFFTEPGGMLLLMGESYANGASLSGNSWGPSGSPRGYDNDTMQVDIGVRDADPNALGNQPLTYVLSIMNGYGGTSSQGTPDEAKNIFNIGSTKMQDSNGSQILEIDDLSGNTAHGPALDGRTIPHMVAPGCRVDSCATGSGYTLMCGTSMASPHVSGAVAVFIEFYRNLPDYTVDPSPAMIKAAFLPVAHDLAGFNDADGGTLGHPFDSKQGWGRMNLDAVVNPPLGVRYFDNPVTFDGTGEEWVTTLSPADASQPMRVMLVWTDAYGHGLGGSTPAWNNDLDLVVEVGHDTYYGNRFGSQGWSIPGGGADYMNNTEGVFLGPMAPSAATVRVVAADINSDGVPRQGDTTDQDFALVCYNCAAEARTGDFDFDGDVDIFDLDAFQLCFTGPGPAAPGPGCQVFDFQPDDDVDLEDFSAFRAALTGPK